MLLECLDLSQKISHTCARLQTAWSTYTVSKQHGAPNSHGGRSVHTKFRYTLVFSCCKAGRLLLLCASWPISFSIASITHAFSQFYTRPDLNQYSVTDYRTRELLDYRCNSKAGNRWVHNADINSYICVFFGLGARLRPKLSVLCHVCLAVCEAFIKKISWNLLARIRRESGAVDGAARCWALRRAWRRITVSGTEFLKSNGTLSSTTHIATSAPKSEPTDFCPCLAVAACTSFCCELQYDMITLEAYAPHLQHYDLCKCLSMYLQACYANKTYIDVCNDDYVVQQPEL